MTSLAVSDSSQRCRACNGRRSKEDADKAPRNQRCTCSILGRWKGICLRHTWTLPLALLIILLSAYALNPTESNPLHNAIFLSYPVPPENPGDPVMYGKGRLDLAFVAFYVIVFSFTREFLMQRIIRPWALYCGIRGKGKMSRFMEQAYAIIYFGVFGPFGLYVMRRSDIWYFNTDAMFEGFPHRTHSGPFKSFYLLEASYWAQQAIVLLLQLEKPRKDFKELVGHHIVTLFLIALSYRFHFMHMGLAVYITHDVSDFFLAASKTLHYLDSIIVGPFFALFIGVWIYMRHYLNLKIIWAVLTDFRTIGPFELNWETQQYKCWLSQYITFSLLTALQSINLFWLFLILRVAKNYVFSNVRQDERSDDEDEEDDDVHENAPAMDEANANPTDRSANGCGKKSRDANLVKRKNAQQSVLQNGDMNATQVSTSANGNNQRN